MPICHNFIHMNDNYWENMNDNYNIELGYTIDQGIASSIQEDFHAYELRIWEHWRPSWRFGIF